MTRYSTLRLGISKMALVPTRRGAISQPRSGARLAKLMLHRTPQAIVGHQQGHGPSHRQDHQTYFGQSLMTAPELA
jgi:hypothetical protein